jgi:hypothetical protein
MKRTFTIFAKVLLVIGLIIITKVSNAQDNFKGSQDSPNDVEKKILSEQFKTYQTFQINPSEIKNALRKSKGDNTKPQKIKLTIGTEIIDFNLFENDILADDFIYFENGKIKEKKQKEVITYSGYIGNDPKNFLRLLISDNRLSGMFKNEKGVFSISHLSDHGIKEANNTSSSKRLIYSNSDDEITSLQNMICGNSLKPVVQLTQKESNQRVAAFSASCKYIKLAIATDYEYFLYENGMNSVISGLNEKIYDMVNKMEFILFNNNQSSYGVAPIGLRLQLSGLVTYTTSNDPFTYTGTDGSGVLAEFTNKINQGQIFTSNVIKNVSHLLSGRPLGFSQSNFTQNQYGQANASTLCSNPSISTSLSTIKRLNNGIIVPYTDAWRIMLHEIGHTLGATDLTCTTSNATMMCPILGKQPYFNQQSLNEINAYLSNNGNCLNSNSANPAYSNFFTLKLNGNNIVSTPVFVNSLTKTVDIPIDPTLPLTSSTFSSSNGIVTVTKINNNKATFKINSAPNFTLNVFAQNSCSYSQWGVPFVYSPSGARIAYNTYPNPADDVIHVDTENITILDELEESLEIKKILLFSENGNFIQEIPAIENKKIPVKDFKNGLYYLHIFDREGNVEKKRIFINHN